MPSCVKHLYNLEKNLDDVLVAVESGTFARIERQEKYVHESQVPEGLLRMKNSNTLLLAAPPTTVVIVVLAPLARNSIFNIFIIRIVHPLLMLYKLSH